MKKGLAFLFLFVFIIICSGCNTVKGAAAGVKKDWEEVKKVDGWLRKNAW